uniref:Uncharacterized protein n=1 Tax=Setaria italica TaxID=4555 RepID=K3ZL15_SETIT
MMVVVALDDGVDEGGDSGGGDNDENFETVKKSAGENVYERSKGCPKHWTVLCFVLELLILKAKHDWSDGSFNDLLRILAWLLQKLNRVPANTYRAKKLVSPFTIGVERIHACPNHCILYRRDTFKGLDKYLVCFASRYKNNSNYCDDDRQGPTDGNKRKRKGVGNSVAIVEPKDTTLGISQKQRRIPSLWKKFDERYPQFGNDPRNVRFALSTDGMNLFGERTSTHKQVKRKIGCMVCIDDTAWSFLEGSRKVVYLGYRRFLVEGHMYQSKKFYNFFGGKPNLESNPEKRDGNYVFNMYLPYWSDLEVRHAIDGMHMKNNVFGNTIGLFLETLAKTKDILKSRQYLVAMKIRQDLHLEVTTILGSLDKGNGRYELPPASYNLTLDEKKAVCQLLWRIRVPSRFSFNIKKLVSMKDLSLSSYNCYDYHVMLTLFLPNAIRVIKPAYVKMVITRLCYFFNKISQKNAPPPFVSTTTGSGSLLPKHRLLPARPPPTRR